MKESSFEGLVHFSVSTLLPSRFAGIRLCKRTRPITDQGRRLQKSWNILNTFLAQDGKFKLRSLPLPEALVGADWSRYAYYRSALNDSADFLHPTLRFFGEYQQEWVAPKWEIRIVTDREKPINDLLLDLDDRPSSEIHRIRNSLAQLMAARRSRISLPSVALRRHQVFLPPGLLSGRIGSPGDTSDHYVVVPYLTLSRDADAPYFRRTFSLSCFLVPVSLDQKKPAAIEASKLSAITNGFDTAAHSRFHLQEDYVLEGDLAEFIGLERSAIDLRGLTTAILVISASKTN